jgi:hypothetical protein
MTPPLNLSINLAYGYGVWRHIQQYFSYNVAVSYNVAHSFIWNEMHSKLDIYAFIIKWQLNIKINLSHPWYSISL